MTTQYTPILKLALPVTGELSGTWGTVVNDNITSMVEQAVAGLSTINTWTSDAHTLTTADGTSSEARCAMLVAQNGAGLTGVGTITCPPASKLYVLKNATSYLITLKASGTINAGSFVVGFTYTISSVGTTDFTLIGASANTIGVSFTATGAGTGTGTATDAGVAVPAGDTAFLFCNGTSVNACVTTIVNGHISGNLTVDGNTTLGNATSDTITATAQFNTDLLPSTDNARDLGSTAKSWRTLYCETSVIAANITISGNTISSTDTNGNITLAPNGTGDVQLDADTIRVGDSGANVTITSNGAGDLILNTNSGTNSGSITIEDGANGNIALAPNGTGQVTISTALDLTNLEVTNIKAKDGTAAMSIADSTGVVTVTKDEVVNGVTVGRGAGAVSTNTAVGASALAANSTGARNTVVGAAAGVTMSTADSVTAVGYGALNANTGSSNTGIGEYALQANSSGTNNTSVGFRSLYSNTYASNNTAVGYQAGYSNTTGGNNISIGYQALNANTIGADNVGMGWRALYNNTTASYNTGVGSQAAYNNSTGTGIVAIGATALYLNTTGKANTAIGGYESSIALPGALYSNTIGSYNTAVGAGALISNTTASNNTAVGYQAAYSNTTGSVTAIGYRAGYSNLSGYGLTAVGLDALRLSTGDRNTAMGIESLTSTTSGTFNTAYGSASALSNTTGSYNTAIGASALYSNTTGSNNTAVGFQALSQHTTGDRNLAIGPKNNAGNGAGEFLYTGSDNVYVGGYDGYYGGTLDLRYESGYLALSDGYGRPLILTKTGQTVALENAVVNATGTGITFPATQSASSNANTLDDYEEGTWTPFIRGSGTAGTYELATAEGGYIKIGKQVTLFARVVFAGSVTGGGTGYMQITGAPSFNNARVSCGAVRQSGLDLSAGYTWLTVGHISTSGTTTLYFDENGDAAVSNDFPVSGVTANDNFYFTLTYEASA